MVPTTTTTPRPTPFSISPDPTTLYLTPAIRSALHKVQYTIETRQGLSVILGDVGLGKSTLMRYLFSKLCALPNNIGTMIPTPGFRSSFTMVKKVCQDFGIDPCRSELAQQEALEGYLIEQHAAGMHVMIFIDEAQRLKADQLELVRTMLNFETSKAKLVSLILAGQLDLREKLLNKKFRALQSRVFSSCMMVPLAYTEMVEMLRARCQVEQIQWPFSPDIEPALRLLWERSAGVPRSVLKACQMAFGLSAELGDKSITPETLIDAMDDAMQEDGDVADTEEASS